MISQRTPKSYPAGRAAHRDESRSADGHAANKIESVSMLMVYVSRTSIWRPARLAKDSVVINRQNTFDPTTGEVRSGSTDDNAC